MALVRQHLAVYPEARPRDVYKLLYHACMGAEHALDDLDAAGEWLDREWEAIGENAEEAIFEDITLHSPMFRLHLRPAKARGDTKEYILLAFTMAGESFEKRPDLLRDCWNKFIEKNNSDEIIIAGSDEITEFNRLLEEHDFPEVRHSEEYRKAYEPAYRLVCREF